MTTPTVTVANKPSFIERGHLRFLIIDAPTELNLEAYIHEMKNYQVTHLARACECSYSTTKVTNCKIQVHDIPFPDGEPPPKDVIEKWLTICQETFKNSNPDKQSIAVHCVAGLGRAPVLVAIALIENGMEPVDAIALIRSKRRGAINAKQLNYLQNDYKRQSLNKKSGCLLM